MSRLPGGRPADGPPRPVPPTAGRPRLESLSRYDPEDDPDRGCLLYEAVVSQDTSRLTSDGFLDRLEAITRIKARLAALEAETVAGFDDSLHGVSADLGHRYPKPGDRNANPGERRWIAGDLRSVSDEIALILSVHRGYATTRIHRSCELVHNFPATLAALNDGLLTERAAFTIVSELSVLDDLDELRAAEAAILDWARTHPLTDLKLACRREAAHRSPAATDKAHQRAHDERSVRMYTDDLGRADIVHNQEATEAAAVMTSLSRAAAHRRRQGDPRTLDQLRADIALDRLLPRTKTTNPGPTADPGHADHESAHQEPVHNEPVREEPVHNEPVREEPVGEEPVGGDEGAGGHPAYEPTHNSAPDSRHHGYGDGGYDGLNGHDGYGDGGGITDPPPSPGPHVIDEAEDETARGAEATVVIHATGDEVLALINAEVATGGEADHHGPIPQTILRKYLTKALAQLLLPNLPTTPNSSRPGAANHRARTLTDHTSQTSQTCGGDGDGGNRVGSAGGVGSTGGIGGRGGDRGGWGGGSGHGGGGSRIELQITDRPPTSDPNKYTPSAALDRYIRRRDRTCQFPGCNRPAEFTDLDHRIAFTTGGPTTAANLWCLCRHHHRLKHEGGWKLHPNTDGAQTWISPTGRHYPNNPTNRPPPPDDHTRPPQSSTDDPQPYPPDLT